MGPLNSQIFAFCTGVPPLERLSWLAQKTTLAPENTLKRTPRPPAPIVLLTRTELAWPAIGLVANPTTARSGVVASLKSTLLTMKREANPRKLAPCYGVLDE